MMNEQQLIELVGVTAKVLAIDEASGNKQINIHAMRRPGTAVWVDHTTGERRYTEPGDPMYSTAIMFAESVVDRDGNLREYP